MRAANEKKRGGRTCREEWSQERRAKGLSLSQGERLVDWCDRATPSDLSSPSNVPGYEALTQRRAKAEVDFSSHGRSFARKLTRPARGSPSMFNRSARQLQT